MPLETFTNDNVVAERLINNSINAEKKFLNVSTTINTQNSNIKLETEQCQILTTKSKIKKSNKIKRKKPNKAPLSTLAEVELYDVNKQKEYLIDEQVNVLPDDSKTIEENIVTSETNHVDDEFGKIKE